MSEMKNTFDNDTRSWRLALFRALIVFLFLLVVLSIILQLLMPLFPEEGAGLPGIFLGIAVWLLPIAGGLYQFKTDRSRMRPK